MSGSPACRHSSLCGIVLAALLAGLAACSAGREFPVEGGTARVVPHLFIPGDLDAPFCALRFRDETSEWPDPVLTILRGGVIHLDALSARAVLPPHFGIFVDGAWVLTASLAYTTDRDCDEYGCSTDTLYFSGRLVLNRQETTALGEAIAAAGEVAELRLQGFRLGQPPRMPSEDFVFRLAPIAGELLQTPHFDCTRLTPAQ